MVGTRPSALWAEKCARGGHPPRGHPDAQRGRPGLGRGAGPADPRAPHSTSCTARRARRERSPCWPASSRRIPVLILNRGVSFPLDRWNRLGYTNRRVTAIVAVCESIKRGLVAADVPADEDRGDLLGHGPRSLPSRMWTAAASARTWASGRSTSSSRRSACARGAATTTCSTRWCACTAAAPHCRLLFVGAPAAPHHEHARKGARARPRRPWSSSSATARTSRRSSSGSDLVVDASYAGLGLTGSLREALAVETPVIGTDLEGVPELIADGETGLARAAAEPGGARHRPSSAWSRIRRGPKPWRAPGASASRRASRTASKLERTEALYRRLSRGAASLGLRKAGSRP